MPYTVQWLGRCKDVGLVRYHPEEEAIFGDDWTWVITIEEQDSLVNLHGAKEAPPKPMEFIKFLQSLGFDSAYYMHNGKEIRIKR